MHEIPPGSPIICFLFNKYSQMLFVTATANGTIHFFTLSLNIEEATAMALQFIMLLKLI
jgi:hypothetical protein